MEREVENPICRVTLNSLISSSFQTLEDQKRREKEKNRSLSKPLRKYYIGTLNANTLVKTGKIKQLTDTLEKFNIKILAIQETRYTDENHFDTGNYRIYKGKPAIRKGTPTMFGTGFAVHKSVRDNILDFNSISERISTITFKSGNKKYTVINVHAPTNDHNRKKPQEVVDFWEDLEELTNQIPQNHIKIVLGDLNAQLGKEKKYKEITGPFTAHNRTNKNGEHFIKYCKNFNLKIMSTQFQKPRQKLTTWRSPNILWGEFQIDHVAITEKNTGEILNVRTRKGFFESDHHLLQVKIRPIPKNKNIKRNKVIRPDPQYLKINKEKIIEEINQNTTDNWTDLANAVQKAMVWAQPPRKRKHRWWNAICDQAIERRIQAWRKFNSNRTPATWQDFHEVQKQSSKEIRKEKRAYDKNRLDEIEEDFKKNNTRNFYRVFKENIKGYQPPNICFKRTDGTLETNTKENCEILKKYFDKLLNCEKPKEKLNFMKNIPNPESQPPTVTEIEEIIKQLKNNRAPGEDGIIAEIWKLRDSNILNKIHRILTEIWIKEEIPQDWKCALIHPLHKKGDKTNPDNYRGISLLPVTYKILSKALLNRLELQVDSLIGEYQAGFRKGRSCAEQIWNLRTILKVRQTNNTVATFVDFKKAYDSIDRQTLFDTLEEYSVDRKTKSLIKQTLSDTTSKIKFLGEISEPFEIHTGVRQGDGLSPLLFNIVLDKIIKEWETKVKGIQLGKTRANKTIIKCLAFADDLVILSNNRQEAQEALELLHEISAKTGLQISYEKTQFMERKKSIQSMHTKYGVVKRVEKFKYLGEYIQIGGSNKASNVERAEKLQKAYKLTWTHYNKRNISRKAKLRHYNTVVLPEALYASETTTIGASGIAEAEKVERKILRKIFGAVHRDGIWMKRPTKELYEDSNKLTDMIKKRRLSFYGHIYRMNDNRLTKKIFNVINCSIKKTNWFHEIEDDLMQAGINKEMINNRIDFRNKIANIKFDAKEKKRTGVLWTEQRKKEHSERMKKFWQKKKGK